MPAEKKKALSLPCFQADQGVLHSPLVEFGHVLMHIGVVVTDIPLCAPIGYCPKSERRGIIMRSLKLEGELGEGKVKERARRNQRVSIHAVTEVEHVEVQSSKKILSAFFVLNPISCGAAIPRKVKTASSLCFLVFSVLFPRTKHGPWSVAQ